MQESPVTKQVEKSTKNEKKTGITNDIANLNEEEIKKNMKMQLNYYGQTSMKKQKKNYCN